MKKFIVMIGYLLLASATSLHAGEKAYLHLDNSAYFLGDTLRLSAYVMDTETRRLTNKSKVLYVELLAPEGYIVETHTYPLENGKCAGDFYLRPLLLSGLFEIRAYTRYMQNDGKTNYYSQAIPIYESVADGNYNSLFMRKRENRNSNKKKSKYNKPEKCVDWNGFSDGKLSIVSAPIQVSTSYEHENIQPYQLVSVKLKGRPHDTFSLSITDKASRVQTTDANMEHWLCRTDESTTLASPSCSYKPEQGISLYGKACQKKSGKGLPHQLIDANLFLSSGIVSDKINTDENGKFDLCLGSVPQDAFVLLRYNDAMEKIAKKKVSISYPLVPATRKYTQEELAWMSQAMVNGKRIPVGQISDSDNSNFQFENSILRFDLMQVIDRMNESGENFTMDDDNNLNGLSLLLMLVEKYYGTNWSSLRTIVMPGEYPGDDVVPSYASINNFGFHVFDAKELIFRTDNPVCKEYAFNNHQATEDKVLPKGTTRFVIEGRIKNEYVSIQDNNKPSLVCCVAPDAKHEWDKYWEYNKIPGVRYLKIAGYTPVLPYRLPNYSVSHPQGDYRRTLYWNPDLQLDENGEATIQFYNNGSSHDFVISGEGISDEGEMIVCK